MEFSKLLEARRSVRAYDSAEDISASDIESMVYAAQQAPSWKNSQTGRYYAVTSKEARESFRKNCLPGFNFERTENALAFVVTSFKKGFSGFAPDGLPTDGNGNGWGCYDLGLQSSLFLLKAKELGYDTLVMGLRKEDIIRKMLGISEDEIIVSVIAIGKGAVCPEKPERKEIADILKIF